MTGRPTKYDPSMIAIAQEYIDSCSRDQMELPTIEGLALKLRVDSDTINNWAKENDEFFGTVKELKEKQKGQLMNDGLYGGKEVNTAMAIFLLKANHGLKETSVQEITGKDGIPLLSALDVSDHNGFKKAETTKAEN